MKSTTSMASSAAVCLLLGAANIQAQERPPEQGQRESDLQQTRQRMMDRRHEDFPEPEGSPPGLAPKRSGSSVRTADSSDLDHGPRRAGRFEDGPAAPGRPAPLMRDEGRMRNAGFSRQSPPQPEGGPGFPPPPTSWGRPESGGFGSYSAELAQGPRHAARFEDGPAAPGRPAPFMRGEGRSFDRPGRPGDFRAPPEGGPGFRPPPMRNAGFSRQGPPQPEGGPGFPPPPTSWGRPSRGASAPTPLNWLRVRATPPGLKMVQPPRAARPLSCVMKAAVLIAPAGRTNSARRPMAVQGSGLPRCGTPASAGRAIPSSTAAPGSRPRRRTGASLSRGASAPSPVT